MRRPPIALAADGLDLVITARATDGTSTYLGTHLDDPAAGMQQVGSLDATAEQCRALGAGVVTVEMDLTDRAVGRAGCRPGTRRLRSRRCRRQ